MDKPAEITSSEQKITRGKRSAGQIIGRILIYAVLIGGAIVFIFPFLWMISNSLMTLGETATRVLLPKVPQWSNYLEAWNQAKFSKYLYNSVLVTLGTLTGLLFTSILAGYAFGRIEFKGKSILFGLFLATMMIPESVTLIPNYLLIRGAILPLPGGSWLNTYWALTIPFMANAFSIFLLRQFSLRFQKNFGMLPELMGQIICVSLFRSSYRLVKPRL